ncbi:hypothetical protein C9374_012881 [Naegleria lovaniensis]|uniref:Uncharacterized protein n=1 Tax=Naegleria lovaniensis TaxID=51637 RepID=A0AA88G6K5_NAELO|nr:uncharacterized protein C9374_012881 [Naegleria lovaniensis]KAG2373035.1 hypothetical protein C9374_012881 [Naegleria lovaniensis]
MVTRADRLRRKKKNTTKAVDTIGKLRKLKKHFPELTQPLKPKPGFTKQPEESFSSITNEEELRLEREITENPLSYDARLKLKREMMKREFRDDLSKLNKEDEAKFQLSFTPKATTPKKKEFDETKGESSSSGSSETKTIPKKKVKKHLQKPITFTTNNALKRLNSERMASDSLTDFWEGTDNTKRRKASEPPQEIVQEVKKAFYNPISGQSYNPSLNEYKKALKMASKGESKLFNQLDNVLNQLTNRQDDVTSSSATSSQSVETSSSEENEEKSTEEKTEKQKPKFLRKKKILSLTKRKGLRQHKGDLLRSLLKKKRAVEDTINVAKLGKRLLKHREEFENILPKLREKRQESKLKKLKKDSVQSSNDVMIHSEKDIDEAFKTEKVEDTTTLSSVSSFREMQSGNSAQLWTSFTKRFHDTKTVHNRSYSKGNRQVGEYII